MTSMIKGKYNDPIFPAEEDFGDNTAKYVCYQSDVLLMQKQLRESLEHFVKTKQVLEIPQSRPSEVYTFTEDFKLTGQHLISVTTKETVFSKSKERLRCAHFLFMTISITRSLK